MQFHWRNRGWPDFDAFLAEIQRTIDASVTHERHPVFLEI